MSARTIEDIVAEINQVEGKATDQIVAGHLADGYRGKLAIVRVVECEGEKIQIHIRSKRCGDEVPEGFGGGRIINLNVPDSVVEEFFRRYGSRV
jgi:hypothetical protein